ncbi:hypothetical protein SAMN05216236_10575 [Sedimentitalea nanhaiensis]|uniref:Uncharacterized protein n=1 Tax=Sedimentitalea nanhaiensis TaxID=999627 RepID=A0A1I6ZYZ0_9RHOB|nr:hypothetical protein SAMN05216236_10575 [Sedimentitalea nanhaiensis]
MANLESWKSTFPKRPAKAAERIARLLGVDFFQTAKCLKQRTELQVSVTSAFGGDDSVL